MARVPRLRGRTDVDAQILGGFTNRTWRIDTGGERFVLRIPGPGTNALTDRHLEARNLRLAVAFGLAPEVVWLDADEGLLVTRYINNARPLANEDIEDVATRRAMLALLGQLHAAPPRLVTRLDPIATSRRYLAVCGATPALTDVTRRLEASLAALADSLSAQPVRVAPCHVDANPTNFVSDGQRLWLVDYEYAAHCHPLWDVVCLAAECGWQREQLDSLLADWPAADGSENDAMLDAWWEAFSLTRLAWLAAQVAAGNRVEESLADLQAQLG